MVNVVNRKATNAKSGGPEQRLMLITVEGIDGSGKTTVCRALEEALTNTRLTREPTESWYGEAVRRSIATDDADPLAELFLYTADHAAHLADVIEPALAAGEVVISDRYSDSRYAYQGATLAQRFENPIEFVKKVHAGWTRPPDLTLYLDVPASVGAERADGSNKFEREVHLQAVRNNYEILIREEPERFHRIDATASEAIVRSRAMAAVESTLQD